MKIKAEYVEGLDTIISAVSGVAYKKNIMELVSEIKRLSDKHDCKRSLLDTREAEIRLSTMDIHVLPEMLGKIGIDRAWKRAIVVNAQKKDFRFYKDVATNRGYNVRLFTDKDEAIRWLIS